MSNVDLLPSLFEAWEEYEAELREALKPLGLFDFKGE